MKVLEAQHHLFVARGKAWNARGTGALLYSLVQVGRAISRPKLSCPIHESMSQSPRGVVLSLVHRDFQGCHQRTVLKQAAIAQEWHQP